MQNAKDTFYIALRDRLAALDPSRVIVLRDATRPAVWVAENELFSANDPADSFCLNWASLRVDAAGELPLVTLGCEIRYATDGTAGSGGMDRGRLLAEMDAVLAAAVNQTPQNAPKMNYAGSGPGTAPSEQGTNIFWSNVAFGPLKSDAERLGRVATVEIFAYREAGEL